MTASIRTRRLGVARIRSALGILAVFAGSGVVALPAKSQAPPTYDLLWAQLYEPVGGRLQFSVSRPAYVAIFEVVPGIGMSMLHPWTTYGTQRRFSAGSHSYQPQRTGFSRNLYSHAGYSRFNGPIVLVLIASERPLRTEGLPRVPSALLNQFGFASYQPASTFDAIERLAERIVPDADYTDWTFDTYTIWPAPQLPVLALHPVLCADGQVRFIRGGRLPPGCLRAADPVTSGPDTAKAPRDSTKDRARRVSTEAGRQRETKPRATQRPRSPEAGAAGDSRKVGSSRTPSGGGGAATSRPGRTSGGTATTGGASGGSGRKAAAVDRQAPSQPKPSPAPAPAPSGGPRGDRSSEAAPIPRG